MAELGLDKDTELELLERELASRKEPSVSETPTVEPTRTETQQVGQVGIGSSASVTPTLTTQGELEILMAEQERRQKPENHPLRSGRKRNHQYL